MGTLTDRVALVTGAAGNLGRAVSKRLAAEGARLVLVDQEGERLAALAAEIGGALSESADLSRPEAVEALIGRLEAAVGRVEIVVHTVGGFAAGKPVHEETLETLQRMYALNVVPIYVFCGRIARHMVERGVKGKIAIVLARAAYKGAANAAAYAATKAAAQRLMESMALELRDRGINVNGVAPSIIDTPPNRAAMADADFSRWVTPDSLADATAFLVSDAARDLHGVTLDVFGRA
jgi:NAD(P)-dependent dehydrogenase (short-subunit alcohol dehydrogenase family)